MKLADDMRFEARWLKVESIFKAVGWDVVYDAPAYCESYDPTFTFKKSK